MSQGVMLAGLGCFLWGMVSVLFSPCHPASIPLIIGYVGRGHSSSALSTEFYPAPAPSVLSPDPIISVQNRVLVGILFILFFAVGHCLPIVVAGSSTASVGKLVVNSALQQGGRIFRRLAGALIAMLGVYFIAAPFVTA